MAEYEPGALYKIKFQHRMRKDEHFVALLRYENRSDWHCFMLLRYENRSDWHCFMTEEDGNGHSYVAPLKGQGVAMFDDEILSAEKVDESTEQVA